MISGNDISGLHLHIKVQGAKSITTPSDAWSLAIQGACGYAAGQLCSVILNYQFFWCDLY